MLQAKHISFAYNQQQVLKHINFEVDKGDNMAILGESGSGKSTLLKAIYGLLHLEAGSIYWKEERILGPHFKLIPGEHFIKYVAQEFDLMPYTTVEENIAVHLSPFTKDNHPNRIAELLKIVGLLDYSKTKVRYLSGGEKQRVALAKALANEPEILLLDEPFSHIDTPKKHQLRNLLFPYLKRKEITTLIATHDPEDVLPYSDQTLILKAGIVEDFGPTKDVYQLPKSFYTANLFSLISEVAVHYFKREIDSSIRIILYPHEFKIVKNSSFKVQVMEAYFLGSHYLIEARHEIEGTIYFNTKDLLAPGKFVCLKISKKLIRKRAFLN